MNYNFEITIKRMVDKSSMGTKLIFDGTDDLEEIFTPKIVSIILKSWAKTLEERQTIIPCPEEQIRRERLK